MFLLVLLILAAVFTLGALAVAIFSSEKEVRSPAVGAVVIGLIASVIIGFFSMVYSQDEGEAKVKRSASGEVVGSSVEAGWHVKAPWVSAINFDIRNNVVEYVGDGAENHSGGDATGPQITFQDRDGVTGNLDIVVSYSVMPDQVEQIYEDYGSQEAFVKRVVEPKIRSIARDVPTQFSTIEVYNQRAAVGLAIEEALEAEWDGLGLVVAGVDLQEIRYPEATVQGFTEAQQARTRVEAARADQQRAEVEADTRVIEAEGAAEANRVLSESLSPEVLQQRYIEALRESGQVYVVPEGSQPMVGIPATPGE